MNAYYRTNDGTMVHLSDCRYAVGATGQPWLWADGTDSEVVRSAVESFGYRTCKACRPLEDTPEGPTTEQVAEQTGATYRQLDHWTRRGYIKPTMSRLNFDGNGTGYGRIWPDEEVEAAAVMVRLVVAGVSPRTAAQVARGDIEIGPGIRIVMDEEAA